MPSINLGKVIADPPTTESLLALLEDQELPVGAIILGNASAITLDTGAFAGDGAGNAVVGDGSTLGGIRLMKDVPLPSQHFLNRYDLTSPVTQSRFIEIGSIALTADIVAVTTSIDLAIDLEVGLLGTSNLTELGLAFISTTQTPGLSNVFMTPTAPASRNDSYSWQAAVRVNIEDILGEVTLAQFEVINKVQCLACPATSGNVLGHFKLSTGLDFTSPQPITLGSATALKFGVWIKTSDAFLAGELFAKSRWTYKINTP